MNGLPIEIIVILCGVGLVALGWILLRFGKTIARWGLIFGVLAVALVFGLSVWENSRATRKVAQVAQVATASTVAMTGLAWVLIVLLLVAVGVIIWLLVRERWGTGIKRLASNAQQRPTIVYVGGGVENYDDAELTWDFWG